MCSSDLLADNETFELNLLQDYLPQQLSEQEIAEEVVKAITEIGAVSAKDMGKAMGLLKTRLAGKADMAKVSTQLKAKLAS